MVYEMTKCRRLALRTHNVSSDERWLKVSTGTEVSLLLDRSLHTTYEKASSTKHTHYEHVCNVLCCISPIDEKPATVYRQAPSLGAPTWGFHPGPNSTRSVHVHVRIHAFTWVARDETHPGTTFNSVSGPELKLSWGENACFGAQFFMQTCHC